MKEKNYTHGYRQAMKDIKLAMDKITLGDWNAVTDLYQKVNDNVDELSPTLADDTEEPTQKYFLNVTRSKGNAVCDYVSEQAYAKYHHALIEDTDWPDIVDDIKQLIEQGMKKYPRCKRPDFLSRVWDDTGVGMKHGLQVKKNPHDDTPALAIYLYKLKELCR
jgi:hypothetical protein